jgi:hypothetical protein
LLPWGKGLSEETVSRDNSPWRRGLSEETSIAKTDEKEIVAGDWEQLPSSVVSEAEGLLLISSGALTDLIGVACGVGLSAWSRSDANEATSHVRKTGRSSSHESLRFVIVSALSTSCMT